MNTDKNLINTDKAFNFPSSQEGIKGWCLNYFPLKTNKYKMKKNHFLLPPPNPLLKGGGILALT
jgi:hypothetical protein